MPGEMDAELRNTLRSLQAAVEGVGRAQKKTTDEVNRFEDAAKRAFRQQKMLSDDAAKSAKTQASAWRNIGSAIGQTGGPISDMVARFTGLQSAEKGLSRLALAATAIGVAMRLVTTGLERAGLQARESAASWRSMTEAILSAKEKSLAIGTAGVGQLAEQRKLIAAGPEAVAQAKELSESNSGIDESDANAGVSAIYSKYGAGARAKSAVRAAKYLARTGAMSFGEAANSLIEYGGDTTNLDASYQIQAQIYANATGRVNENPYTAYNQAQSAVYSDPYLNAAGGVVKTKNLTRGVQRDAVVSGLAQTAASNELAEARDPVAAAVSALANTNALAIQELQKIADGQNGVLEWLKHYTTGSERDKLERTQTASGAGAAVYQPGG